MLSHALSTTIRCALLTIVSLVIFVGSAIAGTGYREIVLTHTAFNVTTTSAESLAANTSRRWLLIENDSDTAIYCKVGVAAVLNQGVRLNANGGSWELSPALGNYNTGAINCIHGGVGNKVLLVIEGQ